MPRCRHFATRGGWIVDWLSGRPASRPSSIAGRRSPWRTGAARLTLRRMTVVIGLLLVVGLVFQVWVTVQVWRSDLFQRDQKAAQSKLIWMLPVLGAVIVHAVLTEEDKHDHPTSDRSMDRRG